jgi:hypothetical protein
MQLPVRDICFIDEYLHFCNIIIETCLSLISSYSMTIFTDDTVGEGGELGGAGGGGCRRVGSRRPKYITSKKYTSKALHALVRTLTTFLFKRNSRFFQ